MRVLVLTHYWLPHKGGVETLAREQSLRLVRRGHRVSVLTSRLKGDPEHLEDRGISVHRVRAINPLEPRGVPYPLLSWQAGHVASMLARDHDVLLAYGHTYLASVLGVRAARRHRRPVVLMQASPFVRYGSWLDVVQRMADRTLGRYTLRSAASIIAISEYTAGYVKSLVPDRPVEVLVPGVDTGRFTPAGSPGTRKELRERLGLPLEATIFLTVRRLVFRNGLDTLLAACSKLKSRGDISVVIGGFGPQRSRMESRIRQEGLGMVRLAGFIPDDLLPDFYRAVDAFVLPTRTGEGLGLVLLEAFACGIPAIATGDGGQEELLFGGETGVVVPPEDPAALATAMARLADDPERRFVLGRRALDAATRMDWAFSVDRLEEILEVALTSHRRTPYTQ